ncbi:MAG: hypothetical protein IE886_05920 [Campylobacterales bacterium]|nr:hypothetical protein [Campylobacterales bacterium]
MERVAAFLLLAVTLCAQEWALITRADSPLAALDAAQIRDIYLGKMHYVDSVRVYPLQPEADDPLRRQFEREMLGLSRAALREWWIRRHYLGQRPPKVMGSAEAVVAYVRQVEGAVGYVPYRLASDANVTVLFHDAGAGR